MYIENWANYYKTYGTTMRNLAPVLRLNGETPDVTKALKLHEAYNSIAERLKPVNIKAYVRSANNTDGIYDLNNYFSDLLAPDTRIESFLKLFSHNDMTAAGYFPKIDADGDGVYENLSNADFDEQARQSPYTFPHIVLQQNRNGINIYRISIVELPHGGLVSYLKINQEINSPIR